MSVAPCPELHFGFCFLRLAAILIHILCLVDSRHGCVQLGT